MAEGKKIKILYVSANGYMGGAENFVVNTVLGHLERKKVEAKILFFSSGEALLFSKQNHLNITLLNSHFRLRNPLKLMKALLEIRKIVLDYKPDIIHSTMAYSHLVISLACMGLSIKKVWFQHGPVGGILDRLGNFFKVDMLWFNSLFLKDEHFKLRPRCKIKYGETIIKLSPQVKNIASKKIFQNDEVTIGAAGRICPWKGMHNIAMALYELQKENKFINFKLIVAGSAKTSSDQEYEKELKKLVIEKRLAKKVFFLNHLEKMDEFYERVDIFIHSSTIPEPLGLVAMEAMSKGCLLIGSDVGGISDFLINSSTGLTYDSTGKNAIKDLIEILEDIFNKKNKEEIFEFQNIAKNGQAFILANYSQEKMLDQIENLYFEISESRS